MVQFAEDPIDRCEYAIKFFLDREAFLTEAALYASCSRAMAATLSTSAIASLARYTPHSGSTGSGVLLPDAVAQFLPQVEAVHDDADGNVCDLQGRALPPCIVMEKGESLHDWSDRAKPDIFMTLAVQPLCSPCIHGMHGVHVTHLPRAVPVQPLLQRCSLRFRIHCVLLSAPRTEPLP